MLSPTPPLTLAGVPLVMVRLRRAKNYTLSFNARKQEARLTLPWRASVKAGLEFARRKEAWLEAVQARTSKPEIYRPNARVPLLGEEVLLLHDPGTRLTRRSGNTLSIGGEIAFFERRVRDALKAELLHELRLHVQEFCRVMGRARMPTLSIKTMHSRWGSCSSSGSLSFALRLVHCPKHVVRYLVAHECAHLAYMNHSRAFWAQVRALMPEFETAHAWLKNHGKHVAF